MGKYVKALAVADSHGNMESLRKIARDYAAFDYLFHLGDNVRDAVWLSDHLPDVRFFSVRGNCDPGESAPDFEEVVICGKRIILTHGHLLKVKYSCDRALYYAQEHGADAILFGHSHMALKEYVDGTWLINPGSAGEDGRGPMSVAVLMIGEAGIAPKIVLL